MADTEKVVDSEIISEEAAKTVEEKKAEAKEATAKAKAARKEATKKNVEATAAAVKETAEKTAKKTKEAAKKGAEAAKETAKKTAKKTAEKAKTSIKEKTEAPKRKYTRKPVKNVIVQFLGQEISEEELTERAIAQFAATEGAVAVKTITLYIKPEDNAAYYVINDQYTGRVDF